MTQENLRALQQFQQQTADLHRQFLEGQEATRATFERLFTRQQNLLSGQSSVQTPAPAQMQPAQYEQPDYEIQKPAAPRYQPEPEQPTIAKEVPEETAPATREQPVVETQPAAPEMPDDIQAAADTGEVEQVLLDVVSEKTGYPVDMLDLDMGLDADLGIDSIKRVEILSALQSQLPDAPEIGSDQIGNIQTLRQIVEFLSVPTNGKSHASAPASETFDSGQVESVLLQVVAEKTGYPEDMLDLDMGLDADLGIDSIKRVEILSALQNQLPDAPEIGSEQIGQIQNLRQIVNFLNTAGSPPASRPAVVAQVQAVPAGLDQRQVENTLLQVVAEKTGYPEDMLDLDMGLDADLGIDSIKRVEILSELQNQLPDAPEIGSDQISQIQNLRQIVDFLARVSEKQSQEHGVGDVKKKVVSPVSEELPDLSSLERSLVVPVKLSQPDSRDVVSLPAGSLILLTDDGTEFTTNIEACLDERGFQVQRIALNDMNNVTLPDSSGGLVILSPSAGEMPACFLKDAFTLLQSAGPGLRKNPSLFVTVSKLDGMFGFGSLNASSNPLSGGLAGLTKTVAREWPDIQCKALDVAADLTALKATAASLTDEMFRAGPVEVGISDKGNITLELQAEDLLTPVPSQANSGLTGNTPPVPPQGGNLTSDDVVVITGGARGVTAECAAALARSSQATLVLLGRSSEPAAEPSWLAGLQQEGDIKKAIIAHAGRKMTPKDVEQEFRRISANREILRTLDRLEAAGSTVAYHAVDIRNMEAVRQAVDDIHQRFGEITGLVHGAGVLADRKIEDKTREQFEKVYDTKVEGLRNLLRVLASNPLKIQVYFSSTTARLGRIGQVDYAIANEVLNKTAQQQSRLRPECRVLSVNWGPWAGGMVTPALEKVFESEGIALIPLEAGAHYLVQELAQPRKENSPVEVVVLGSPFGVLQSGQDARTPQDAPEVELSPAFEQTLNAADHPFLRSHVMNDRAVLPAAVMLEWMAHAALHDNPGLVFHGFNDMRVLKGVIAGADTSCQIQLLTGKKKKEHDEFLVPVELRSLSENGQAICHARTNLVLTGRLPQAPQAVNALTTEAYPHQQNEIYQKFLFHGEHFQGIERIEGISQEGIIAHIHAAPQPSEWLNEPMRNHWLTDPLVIDGSFQLLIVWSFSQYQSGSLPTFIRRYRQYAPTFPADGSRVVAQVTESNQHRALSNVEFLDAQGTLIARMEDYECTIDASLNQAFRRNKLSA